MTKLFLPLMIVAVFGWQCKFKKHSKDAPVITSIYNIPGPGGWDYIAVGPGNNRLYVAHGYHFDVLNQATGDSVGIIPNTTGAHGVAFYEPLKKGYATSGKLNTATIFDLETNKVLGFIPTGENPDDIIYEPFSKKMVLGNGRGKSLTVFDPVTDSVIATIPVSGKPEAIVSDRKGKLFVNIEDKDEIVVVNMTDYTVMYHWPVAPGKSGKGLAIDIASNRLFAGCENKQLVVLDAANGKVISNLPIGAGCDGVAFDNSLNMIYSANKDGTLTVIRKKSADSYEVIAEVETPKYACTIAIDTNLHRLYVPTASLEKEPAPGTKKAPVIPGTFKVLVLQSPLIN